MKPEFFSIIKELLRGLLLVFLVAIFCFVLLDVSPIDPISYFNHGNLLSITPQQSELLAQELGLRNSVFERFTFWVINLTQGQLGFAHSLQQPVADVIKERLPLTFNLMLFSWLGSLFLGYFLGVTSALASKTWVDRTITFFVWVTASVPAFWLGILLLFLFAVVLNVAPVCCAAPIGFSPQDLNWSEKLPYIVLPAVTLILSNMGPIIMHTREKTLDVINSDHFLYAKLHGESKWGLFRFHIFKNSLGPAFIIHFANISDLIGGSILVETVFSYPGLGGTLVTAGLSGDAALLISLSVLSAFFVYVGNMTANVVNRRLLPQGVNNA